MFLASTIFYSISHHIGAKSLVFLRKYGVKEREKEVMQRQDHKRVFWNDQENGLHHDIYMQVIMRALVSFFSKIIAKCSMIFFIKKTNNFGLKHSERNRKFPNL